MLTPLALVLLTLLPQAPQGAAAAAPMELSFTRVIVAPGATAALPVYLVANDVYREPFQITLEFPDRNLKFEKVELAYLSERAKWKISGSVKPHPEKSDRQVLLIDVVPDASTFFPSGAVAHAHFLVSKETKVGDVLLDAALIAPAGSTPMSTAKPAKIIVSTTPIFGCFFYMH
jgi:hypothetical protein